MLVSIARVAILAFALLAGVQAGRADDLADFNAAVEIASAHNRVAIGYLRTGSLDLALLEIDRLREAWGKVAAGKRAQVFDSNPLYVSTMTDIGTRLVAIDLMVKMGKPDNVRHSLEGIRDDLYKLRKSAGIVVLADCVLDAGKALDALMVYNDETLDLAKAETRDAIAAKAQSYRSLLDRCDAIAGDSVRNNADFRRLIDGARNGLLPLPHALSTRDGNQLHRILIELRSYDNLLAFRFG
jgi:hypothetical protein